MTEASRIPSSSGLLSSENYIFTSDDEVQSTESSLPKATTGPAIKTFESRSVKAGDLMKLREMNSILFPMTYQDRYYREVLHPDSLARLVYVNGTLVGTYSCRLQNFVENNGSVGTECYIMTFGVLAAYRRLGLGARMLEEIVCHYQPRKEVKRITLHVHSINDAAIKFYLQSGFSVLDSLPNYYKRLSPPSAHILTMPLNPSSC